MVVGSELPVNNKVGKKSRACPGSVMKQIVASKNIRLGKGNSFSLKIGSYGGPQYNSGKINVRNMLMLTGDWQTSTGHNKKA